LSHSLFDRMWRTGVASTMLNQQYRMHPDIAAFPARYFYFNKLGSAVEERDRPLLAGRAQTYHKKMLAALGKDRVLFIDVADGKERMDNEDISKSKRDGASNSRVTSGASMFSFVNEVEASVVLRAVCGLPFAQEDIGVISPYSGQTRLLSRKLRLAEFYDVDVATVDGFQGREKECIVFSAVRSNAGGLVGFLNDWRRLNVAMTRAKAALIVVGSAATLKNDKHWSAWMRRVQRITVDDIGL
jgi:superfamily I DNA and/or RNA helicase